MSKLRATAVAVGRDILTVDTIEHEGLLWLVPNWTERPDLKLMRPERIILLSTLRHSPHGDLAHDYVLHDPLPKSLLYGPNPKSAGPQYVVEMHPEILVPVPDDPTLN